jgi:dynein heavy chain
MEGIIEHFNPDEVNPDFRLWLTAMPSPDFPISVLQNSIKMTVEPPKGLRNSLQRAYLGMDEEWFNSSTKPAVFKKMLFGLCFFHGLVLERRAFGPVGWNIPYGFSEPDLDISQKQLRNFLEDFSEIPYAALNYMVAEANYGGRVTDAQDRRAICSILKDYYTNRITESDYKFSVSGIYYAPEATTIEEHLDYIKSLPLNHTPEVFWLHNNANLTASINEATSMLGKGVQLMSSFKAKAAGGDDDDGPKDKTPEQMFSEIAAGICDRIPEAFDISAVMRKYPVKYEQCLNTVLMNELIKFNRLLNKVKDSTSSLQKAVKGLVIFSPELEELSVACLTNKIPDTWKDVSYPSLKPLQSYVNDFLDRLKFCDDWIKQGAPNVFWFSAYFFQQAFLTGVLQNFARQGKLAIDKLMWNFAILKEENRTPDAPEKGAYINGLFIQGARWDDQNGVVADSFPKVLWSTVPIIWLKPNEIASDEHDYARMYACPVYKTSDRRGVLSTSGHSSNYIMWMYMSIASQHSEDFWTKRGVAMISQTDD